MGDTSVLSRFRLRAGVEVVGHFYPPGKFIQRVVKPLPSGGGYKAHLVSSSTYAVDFFHRATII